MAPARRPPLDELMIVNPGTPANSRALVLRRAPHAKLAPEQPRRADQEPPERRFFLGSDGTLYEVIE
jgi:hypothetical protein